MMMTGRWSKLETLKDKRLFIQEATVITVNNPNNLNMNSNYTTAANSLKILMMLQKAEADVRDHSVCKRSREEIDRQFKHI